MQYSVGSSQLPAVGGVNTNGSVVGPPSYSALI